MTEFFMVKAQLGGYEEPAFWGPLRFDAAEKLVVQMGGRPNVLQAVIVNADSKKAMTVDAWKQILGSKTKGASDGDL